MKRKPLEKLSVKLQRLFLTCVKKYDRRYFNADKMIGLLEPKIWESVPPIRFADEMVRRAMEMIAEYEPEDIE